MAPELLPVPPTKGGAIERWIRDAAGRLVGRGHDVHVVARDHGDGVERATIDGVHYHFIRIPPALDRGLPAAALRGLWYYRSAGRIVRRLAPDVVHHHSRPAGLWLCGGDAPTVISLHSMEYGWGFGHRGWDRRFFRRGLCAAARVLCVSDFIRRHTLERYPQLEDTAITLYNGVDGGLFRPADARQTAADGSASAQVILYVGRVEERKGVQVLLDAFDTLAARHPEVRLLVVGPHSYWNAHQSAYYNEVVRRAKAHPRIELRGPTYVDDELAQVYRSATVSVVPSTFPEALGLTSLEAQASGVPVVVSDAGGLPETVSPGESGLVFRNQNVAELADAVTRVLVDRDRREAMATGARAWAMKTFSWDVIAAQLEGVYDNVLAGAAL